MKERTRLVALRGKVLNKSHTLPLVSESHGILYAIVLFRTGLPVISKGFTGYFKGCTDLLCAIVFAEALGVERGCLGELDHEMTRPGGDNIPSEPSLTLVSISDTNS